MTTDVSSAEYWSDLYRENDVGWDKGRCAPPIARLLAEGVIPHGGKVAVIGCGRGHEAIEAARLGYRVTAIDFAPEAITAVTQAAQAQNCDVVAIEADLFDLATRWPAGFDAIIEHTCLCAIDPARRDEYVNVVVQALKPNGLLLGLFYACNKPTAPPYTIGYAEILQRFMPQFDFERLQVPPDSFENRLGNELEFIARKRR